MAIRAKGLDVRAEVYMEVDGVPLSDFIEAQLASVREGRARSDRGESPGPAQLPAWSSAEGELEVHCVRWQMAGADVANLILRLNDSRRFWNAEITTPPMQPTSLSTFARDIRRVEAMVLG